MAQNKKSLKKYEVKVTTKDGKHKVEIPDDILTDSTPLWEDFVVGKFLDISPHVAKVHMVFLISGVTETKRRRWTSMRLMQQL